MNLGQMKQNYPSKCYASDVNQPHQFEHAIDVVDFSLIPSEDLTPGALVISEPVSVLFDRFIPSACGVDLGIESGRYEI